MPISKLNDRRACISHAAREQLLVLEAHLCIQAASSSFYTGFKVGPEQTPGKQLTDLSNGQWNIPALLTLLQKLQENGGEFDDLEVDHDFPGLGQRTMLISARCLAGAEVQRGMIVLSILDTTGQRRIEAEVGELLIRFRTPLASIGDTAIVTDPASRITFMNPTAKKLTGWNQKEALQKHLTEIFNIVNEQSYKTVESPVMKAIRDGAVVGLANHTVLIARDGARWPIDDSAAPIMDVAAAVSVGAALSCAATNPIDVLVRDIGLSDASGHDLMRRIKQFQNVPGVAVSGFGLEADVQSSHDAGFFAHLTKPINLHALHMTIQQALGNEALLARPNMA